MSSQTVSVLRTRDDRVIPVAGVYEIDGAHTSVEFVGRHLMITKVRGRFSDVRGRITIDEEPEKSHVEVEIGVARPRGLRAHLERGARNRRAPRGQDGPYRIGRPSHRGQQGRGGLTAHPGSRRFPSRRGTVNVSTPPGRSWTRRFE